MPTIKDRATLEAQTVLTIFENTTKSITGTAHQLLMLDILESSVNFITDVATNFSVVNDSLIPTVKAVNDQINGLITNNMTAGYIPRYDGTKFVNSLIKEDSAGVILATGKILRSNFSGRSSIDFGAAGNELILSTDGQTFNTGYVKLQKVGSIYSASLGDGNNSDISMYNNIIGINSNTRIELQTGAVRYVNSTPNRVPYLDGNRDFVTSNVTPIELSYLSGVTSPIQSQFTSIYANMTSGYIPYFDGTNLVDSLASQDANGLLLPNKARISSDDNLASIKFTNGGSLNLTSDYSVGAESFLQISPSGTLLGFGSAQISIDGSFSVWADANKIILDSPIIVISQNIITSGTLGKSQLNFGAGGNVLDFTTDGGAQNESGYYADNASASLYVPLGTVYANASHSVVQHDLQVDIDSLTVNIGTGATTINFGTGGSNTTVFNFGDQSTHMDTFNFYGDVNRQDVTNLAVTDKLVTYNVGGAVASGAGTGWEGEENSVINMYNKIDGGRTGFLFKAPTTFELSLVMSSMSADHILIVPNTDGTIATIDGGQTFTNATWNGNQITSTYITSVDWSQITSTPTTLSSYGITDAVPSSRNLTINGVTHDLSVDQTWTIATVTQYSSLTDVNLVSLSDGDLTKWDSTSSKWVNFTPPYLTTLTGALLISNNLSDLSNQSSARSNLGLVIGTDVQAWNADLSAIAALAGSSGFLKKVGAGVWLLDTSTYLTTISGISAGGDLSGSYPSPSVIWSNGYATYDVRYLKLSGGTMTGSLVLSSDPTSALEAATKQYVDTIVTSSVVWLQHIEDPNLIDDSLNTPPTPLADEVYIVGATPTGAWSGLAGCAVWWDGSAWVVINGTPVQVGDRFGVLFDHGYTAGGGLVGKEKSIATVTNNTAGSFTYTFTTPVNGDTVTDKGINSNHKGDNYNYNGTSWVEIFDAITYVGGAGISISPSGVVSIGSSAIINSMLANSSVTIQGSSVSLGGSLDILNGTGFVKVVGTTVSYDNSTYLTTTAASTTYEPVIAASSTSKYWRGDKTFQTLDTSVVPENSNLYYTDIRVDSRVATYTGNVTLTGTVFTIGANQVANSMLVNSSVTIQGSSVSLGGSIDILNGTGFVKVVGTAISYDNSTYLTTTAASTTYAPIAAPTFTGIVTLGQDAASGLQAVTYQQFQLGLLGRNDKEAVKYTTVAALPAVTYSNGASGVGATLTGVAFGALSVDGSTPSVGDRVLVKNQVSTFQNGFYTVTVVGDISTLFVLTRATDFNQSSEILTGAQALSTLGSTLGNTMWAYNGVDNPVIGTDAITFVQTAGAGSFIAGAGINITGTTISVATGAVTNSMLINNSVTIGSTAVALGATVTTIAGLTSVTSTSFTGSLTGNASTAAALQTARNINGVAFNGTGDITITAAASSITIDNTVSTGGAAGRILFESTTNKVSESSLFTYSLAGGFAASMNAGTGTVSPLISYTDAAHTLLTASTERSSVVYDLSSTKQFNTGAITSQREFIIKAPTYIAVAASTITNAATMYISSTPIFSTNVTITNAYTLWTNGSVRFDNSVNGGTGGSANVLSITGNGLGSTFNYLGAGSAVGAASATYAIAWSGSNGTVISNPSTNYQVQINGSQKIGVTSTLTTHNQINAFTAGIQGTTVPLIITAATNSQADAGVGGGLMARIGALGGTVTVNAGAISSARGVTAFNTQIITSASASSYTDLATVHISGVPTAGTNMTLTNTYSLWTLGQVRHDVGTTVSVITGDFFTSGYVSMHAAIPAPNNHFLASNGTNTILSSPVITTGNVSLRLQNTVYFQLDGNAGSAILVSGVEHRFGGGIRAVSTALQVSQPVNNIVGDTGVLGQIFRTGSSSYTLTYTTGSYSGVRSMTSFLAPTALTAAAATTFTDVTGVYMNAPIASTNVTITNAWAAWFQDAVKFNAKTSFTAVTVASPNDGDKWYDSTVKAIKANLSGMTQTLVGLVFANSANSNTITGTTLTDFNTNYTVPANALGIVGKRIRIVARGIYSVSAAGQTLTLQLRKGATTLLTTGARAAQQTATNSGFEIMAEFYVVSTGAGGTIKSGLRTLLAEAAFADGSVVGSNGTQAFDTTVTNLITLSANFGSANAGNVITIESITYEILN